MMKATRFAALILMASATASASPPPLNAPPSVTAYLDQVAATEKPGPKMSLEPVYNAALAAQNDLMIINNNQAWIEGLSDADFTTLQSRLKGFVISRGLEIFADPDPKFFRALAEKRGEPADLAFFTQMEKSIAPDYLPTYVRTQGRGVCIRYGEDLMVPYYAGWLEYQRQSPARYKDKVTELLTNVEDAVGLGTCACGEIESVQNELKGFATRFPTSAVNDKIRDRIEQLDKDPSKLPVNCT